MDISQLEVFLAVAREGGFSRAAAKLFRTQSAVSQAIRKLESEIGEPLFDRSSRDGLLTDAGRVLQEYAERLLNLRNDAQEALVELRELHKGKLAIAANEFTALYLLPVLAEFRRLHPMIKVTVQRALGSHIPDDVLRHNSELGVLTYDPQEPQLHSVVVYLDELIFVVPPSHPLAGERQVSIRQLGAESFVAHIVSSPYREKVIQTFKRHKTPLHMDIELPTLQAINASLLWAMAWRCCRRSAWKTNWRAESWCAFRSANCSYTANCGWCTESQRVSPMLRGRF